MEQAMEPHFRFAATIAENDPFAVGEPETLHFYPKNLRTQGTTAEPCFRFATATVENCRNALGGLETVFFHRKFRVKHWEPLWNATSTLLSL